MIDNRQSMSCEHGKADGALCYECVAGRSSHREPASSAAGTGGSELPVELGSTWHDLFVLDLIGAGGMSAVYRARRHDGSLVALKIIRPRLARAPEMVERFEREARTMASLSHPNIVRVLDSGREPACWMAMEFVDGPSLRQMLAAAALPPEATLRVIPQICDALHSAHERGVVHRDIKPENILIDGVGRAKVADFGLAKRRDGEDPPDLTRPNVFVGTPPYAAPEQVASARDVDRRADVYSLGMVLREMPGGNDGRLANVVAQATAARRDDRFATVAELKDAIELTLAPFLRFEDVTRILGVSEPELKSVIAAGRLAPYWDGPRMKFRRCDVEGTGRRLGRVLEESRRPVLSRRMVTCVAMDVVAVLPAMLSLLLEERLPARLAYATWWAFTVVALVSGFLALVDTSRGRAIGLRAAGWATAAAVVHFIAASVAWLWF